MNLECGDRSGDGISHWEEQQCSTWTWTLLEKGPWKQPAERRTGAGGKGPGNHSEAGDMQQRVWVCARASPVGVGWQPAPYSEAKYDEKQKLDIK